MKTLFYIFVACFVIASLAFILFAVLWWIQPERADDHYIHLAISYATLGVLGLIALVVNRLVKD